MVNAAPGVMKTMLVFTLAMVCLPICSYFVSKNIFENVFGVIPGSSYFYAAIVSIVIVHIILGMFIYVAWTEDDKPIPPDFKRD